jgi:hypothetical protein
LLIARRFLDGWTGKSTIKPTLGSGIASNAPRFFPMDFIGKAPMANIDLHVGGDVRVRFDAGSGGGADFQAR